MSLPDATDTPLVLDGPAGWMSAAACRGIDTELFFPARGEMVTDARAVCAGCTVRTTCLDWALDHGETYGIWGGKSERERRKLRTRRRAERRAAEMATATPRRVVHEMVRW